VIDDLMTDGHTGECRSRARWRRMQFTKRLREGVSQGKITCSVRIWMRPKVKAGGRYRMERGFIEVTSIREISMEDVTPELARASGFKGVVDLMKVAKHGSGRNIYLVKFRYRDRPLPA
jgi:hypothetical protein